uniref:Sodium/calcium exchanger membrane region domain-containing protein n=1 Tax=Setaria italica TaxID=4555 RepID=K3ZB94_SETIT
MSRLAAHLRLSPSMATITLLVLGNGTPDMFASAAAPGGLGGMPRVGLAAVLSAGAFIPMGAFALISAPWEPVSSLQPRRVGPAWRVG